MNVWFTFDYELFFGSETGTVQKCLIEPTNRLLDLSQQYGAPFTFFVDAGFLHQLKFYKEKHPELAKEFELIQRQIQQIQEANGDIQLHIHPHWEKTDYVNGTWHIPQNDFYRLDEFSKDEAARIFSQYKNTLDEMSGKKSMAYRAGGWCIQPFDHIVEVFGKSGLKYDSSIVPGMKFDGGVYEIDFRKAPTYKDSWIFDRDPTVEALNGCFVEIPISGYRYSPLFYWELYIRGRLNRRRHRFVGDGNFIPQPGRKKQLLTRSQWNHVSCDGFYAKKLPKITEAFLVRQREHLVVIGHPKSMTEYSFERLEAYLDKYQGKVNFQTFSGYHDQSR